MLSAKQITSLAFERIHGKQLPRVAAESMEALRRVIAPAEVTTGKVERRTAYHLFAKQEAMSIEMQTNYKGKVAGVGGNSERMEEVTRRWKLLSPAQKRWWAVLAGEEAQARPDAAVNVDSPGQYLVPWMPQPQAWMGSATECLRQDEFDAALDAHGSARKVDEEMSNKYNVPVGVEEAGDRGHKTARRQVTERS